GHGDARALASDDDVRRAARLTVHDGVVDEVVDGAREPVRLTSHDGAVLDAELDDSAAILGGLARRAGERADVDLGRRVDAARLDARERENLAEQRFDARRRFADARDEA